MIEIWNLVFIQFNRGPDKKLTPLPAEACRYRHGIRAHHRCFRKGQQYDTDVFTPIFEAIRW